MNLNAAVQYSLLVKLAEAVPPGQTVYKPGDVINITYNTINVNYTVITTFYGDDLATDVNPARNPDRVVWFRRPSRFDLPAAGNGGHRGNWIKQRNEETEKNDSVSLLLL